MTAKRTHYVRLVMITLFMFLVVAAPAVAEARVLEYQVQYLPVGPNGVSHMIVNVILSSDTTLPATVQVPLPTGATVMWSGEIVGDDPSQDPYREATVTASGDGQIVEFVMSQARVAQVEADYVAPTRQGSTVSVVLPWVNTTEEAPLLVSVRLEPGASDVEIVPTVSGLPLSNEDGETLYGLDTLRLAKGESIDISVVYSLRPSSGEVGMPLMILGGLLAMAVVVLVAILVRDKKRRASAAPSDTAQTESEELLP